MAKQKQLLGWSHLLVITTGAIASFLGLVVMLGWQLQSQTLVQVFPNAPPMRYNTALSFVLSGLALLALGGRKYKIAKLLGIFIGAIGILTLSQYVFNFNLGIDQLLIKDYLSNTPPLDFRPTPPQFLLKVNQALPGRPSPNTAFCLALIGIALVLLSRAMRRRRTSLIAGLCGAVVAGVGTIALIGNLTGIVTAYSWGYSIGVAIHTALGLLVLSTGIMTLALNHWEPQRTQRSPQPNDNRRQVQKILTITNPRHWTIEQKTLAGLSLAALILIGTNIFAYWSFFKYQESLASIDYNSKVAVEIETVLSQLKDAETGQRGFLIVGREEYLEPYNQATQNVEQHLRQLKILIPNNPKLAILNSLSAQKFAELNETIELRRKQGFAAAQQLVQTDRGKIVMDRIRQLCKEMKQEESQYSKQNFGKLRDNISPPIFLTLGIVLKFCLFYLVYYILKQENTKRNEALKAAQESELRWRVLYQTLPIGVVLVDPNDASFVNFNDAVATNLGYTNEEFAYLKISDIDQSLNREEILGISDTILKQNESMEFETQHRAKNGEIRDVLVTGQRLVLNDRTLIYGVWIDITERLAALKEHQKTLLDLQSSERRYRSLIAATTQIVWTTNAQGEVIEEIPGWHQITGQSGAEMKGWGWLSAIHPDDQEHTSQLWQQAVQTKQLYQIEHRLRTSDGSYRDFSVRGVPILNENGEIQEWIGIHSDISERKRTENALRMTQFCVDSATDAISWIGSDLCFAYVNDAMCNSLGYVRSKLLSMSITDVDLNIPLEGIQQIWQAMSQQGSIKFDTLHRRQDGSFLPVEVIANYLQFGDQEYACCFARDITERKIAETELQKSYNLLQTVIEGTPDAIFAKDTQGLYVMINSTGARLIGKSVEEILNKDDCELFSPEFGRVFMENERQIMITGETQISEDNVPMMGSIRIFNTAKSVWRDAQGNVIGIVGIARDITERKRAEQEIKALNEDLERRVLQRTAELTAANKELEAFSYSVSHDLRAPLRGIDGFSQALMDRYSDQLEDKAKHYLTRIRAGTQRMGDLIDDLLTLSRVTRSEMRRQAVDLSAIATEIANELKFSEPERDVEFVITPGLLANGDVQLLRVVLENLFNNAWKFTSARIQTKIEFDAILQADCKIAYFIHDNGAGFDMAYSNKLFGAFQRLHSTTQFPGTGIGLATVQRIITRHGGKVWAEGVVDQGATFYFTL